MEIMTVHCKNTWKS